MVNIMHGEVQIFRDLEQLSRQAAEQFVHLADDYQKRHNRFTVALAGGSTPKTLYHYLASTGYSERIDWSRIEFYWGDERNVPLDHPDSNYHMVQQTLLQHVPISKKNVHPIAVEKDIRHAAVNYAQLLQTQLPLVDDGIPRFDLILLGMGADGHTASLFPQSSILHDKAMVASGYVEKLKAWRVSLTFATINAADHVWILISGAEKAAAFAQLTGEHASDYPISGVRPRGELKWLIDQTVSGETYSS
ncbi:MAG: 6-phosphogluconolactonase [Gammaproteobacteria bacterium]|nr:6-phosphogluconolactonase [Gammaproteobacteria bacterium]